MQFTFPWFKNFKIDDFSVKGHTLDLKLAMLLFEIQHFHIGYQTNNMLWLVRKLQGLAPSSSSTPRTYGRCFLLRLHSATRLQLPAVPPCITSLCLYQPPSSLLFSNLILVFSTLHFFSLSSIISQYQHCHIAQPNLRNPTCDPLLTSSYGLMDRSLAVFWACSPMRAERLRPCSWPVPPACVRGIK